MAKNVGIPQPNLDPLKEAMPKILGWTLMDLETNELTLYTDKSEISLQQSHDYCIMCFVADKKGIKELKALAEQGGGTKIEQFLPSETVPGVSGKTTCAYVKEFKTTTKNTDTFTRHIKLTAVVTNTLGMASSGSITFTIPRIIA